jgi:hypothetical protein
MDKLTPDALTTFLWVSAALVAFALAVWALVDKVKKAREWRQSVADKLDRDKNRIDSLEAGNKVICRGILALLSHEINGNSADKLKDAKDELTNYLIER